MPPALKHLVLGLVLALAACQVASRLPQPPPDSLIDWEVFDGPRLSRDIAEEVNRVRVENGQGALFYLPDLCKAADEQAVHLALINDVEHSNPVPGEHTVVERVGRLGIQPAAVAENALMEPATTGTAPPATYREFAAMLVQAWMDSPGHRANLLDPMFTHTGCAARLGHTPMAGRDRVYAVQVFLLPATRSATVRIPAVVH